MSIFPTKILLATDGSEEAALAARTAVDMAAKTGSELHVLSVGMPDLPDYVELLEEAYRRFERHGQQVLDEQVKKVEEAGGIVAKAHFTMRGPPDQEIVRFAEMLDAGMIVMGSRGLGGIRRALMGSVSDSVVRHAHCPVLVVRGEKDEETVLSSKKILVATDGSEEAALAARTATELAEKAGSELHVVHVRAKIVPHYPGYYMGPEVVENAQQKEQERLNREAQTLLDTQVEEIEACGGSVMQTHLRTGRPDEEIVAQGEELGTGLIVVGNRGWGGIRRALMGNVSDSVVRHAHCPVLVMRREPA